MNHTVKKLLHSQKHMDVARARGSPTKKILHFDYLKNEKYFEQDLTVKPDKIYLVKELEKCPTSSDYNFISESHLRTAVVVGFMLFIQR